MMLPYPEPIHAYMKIYKPGNWWLYENTVGLPDSVYLTEHIEKWYTSDPENRRCMGLPWTEFALKTVGMDTAGTVYTSYLMGSNGTGGIIELAAARYKGWTLFRIGFDAQGETVGQLVQDTVLGGVQYQNVLRIDRDPSTHARHLETILLAKDIGIIGYTTQTDTFTLSSYHIQ